MSGWVVHCFRKLCKRKLKESTDSQSVGVSLSYIIYAVDGAKVNKHVVSLCLFLSTSLSLSLSLSCVTYAVDGVKSR